MNVASEVASRLLQIKAIKLSPQNPFIWSSGLKSPIYCDNRILLSYPEIRTFILEQFLAKIPEDLSFNVVAGVATGGIPLGTLIADRLKLPFVYVRSKPKSHGRQNHVEGQLPENPQVLVIEDLISSGESSLNAVRALQNQGSKIAEVLAIFTYGFAKAQMAFEQEGCSFKTLSDYPRLLEVAVEQNYISPEILTDLEQWSKDPQAWSDAA